SSAPASSFVLQAPARASRVGSVGVRCIAVEAGGQENGPRDVQDNYVPLLALDLCKNLLGVLGLCTDGTLQFAHQDFLQSPAQDGMIVGNENSDHFVTRLGAMNVG